MASKSKPKEGKVPYNEWVWVLDNLTKTQLEAHDKKPYSATEIMEAQHNMLEMGFKLGAKEDTYNKCWQVTAICDDLKYDNAGLAVSARGNDIHDCWSILVYKVFTVADGDLRGFADKVPKGVRG